MNGDIMINEPQKPELTEEEKKKLKNEADRREFIRNSTPEERASLISIKRFWDDEDEDTEV